MKKNIDRHLKSWGISAFLVVAACILFYYAVFHMGSVKSGIKNVLSALAPLLYGITIAYLLNPIINFLEYRIIYPLLRKNDVVLKNRGKKILRWICVLIAMLFFIFIIILLVMMILPQTIRSLVSVINSVPTYIENVEGWINNLIEERGWNMDPDAIASVESFTEQAQEFLNTEILPQVQGMLKNITSGIVDLVVFFKNFLIGAIISLYIMADKENFIAKGKMIVYAVLPGDKAHRIIDNMRFTNHTFGGFISGKIIDSAIIGVLCYGGCTFMEMPYALLISTIIGVTNIIPFFGPFLGAIPCFILILMVSPIKSIYFIIFILILQQFDGNILGPKILGDYTGLTSFMVIVAIMIGGGFFGFPGMLLGVPVFAVIHAGFWTVIGKHLESKDLPVTEEAYVGIDKYDLTTKEAIPLPPRYQRREVKKRNNIFMIIWNALMKIIVPFWGLFVQLITFLAGRVIYFFIWLFTFLKENWKLFFRWIWGKMKKAGASCREMSKTIKQKRSLRKEAKQSRLKDQEMKQSELKNQEVKQNELKNPEMKQSELKNQEMKQNELRNQEVKQSELKNPEIKQSEPKNPEMKQSELKNPEMKQSELKNQKKKRNIFKIKNQENLQE